MVMLGSFGIIHRFRTPNVRLQARAACGASICKPLLGMRTLLEGEKRLDLIERAQHHVGTNSHVIEKSPTKLASPLMELLGCLALVARRLVHCNVAVSRPSQAV